MKEYLPNPPPSSSPLVKIRNFRLARLWLVWILNHGLKITPTALANPVLPKIIRQTKYEFFLDALDKAGREYYVDRVTVMLEFIIISINNSQ